jgi:hypothetical protein
MQRDCTVHSGLQGGAMAIQVESVANKSPRSLQCLSHLITDKTEKYRVAIALAV